jgi:hypothetical protein
VIITQNLKQRGNYISLYIILSQWGFKSLMGLYGGYSMDRTKMKILCDKTKCNWNKGNECQREEILVIDESGKCSTWGQ